MKHLLIGALLLGFTVPSHALDHRAKFGDLVNAMRDKHFPLAVMDVLSKDEAFGFMSSFAECAGFMTALADHGEKTGMPEMGVEINRRRASYDYYRATTFWDAYSAHPTVDIDGIKERAQLYYRSLLETGVGIDGEGKLSEGLFEKGKSCVRPTKERTSTNIKIHERYEERAERDPETRDTFLRSKRKGPWDPSRFGRFFHWVGTAFE